MKFLLFCVAGIISSAAFSQTKPPQSFRYNPGIGLNERRNGVWQNVLSDSAATHNSLVNFRAKKPGIYRLPQDGMPCIVPDSTQTVRIPNLWRGSKQGPFKGTPPRIPNLLRPEFLSYATR